METGCGAGKEVPGELGGCWGLIRVLVAQVCWAVHGDTFLKTMTLIIHRFCACKFTSSWKFIYNPPKSIFTAAFTVIHGPVQSSQMFKLPGSHAPSGNPARPGSASLFCSHAPEVSSWGAFGATVYVLVILLSKMHPPAWC